jgi:hypothetical protein
LTTRVLELFAKRGLTPNRFWGQIKCGPDPKMELDVQASDVAPEVAAHIARCMAQIFGVEKVSLAEFGGGS